MNNYKICLFLPLSEKLSENNEAINELDVHGNTPIKLAAIGKLTEVAYVLCNVKKFLMRHWLVFSKKN